MGSPKYAARKSIKTKAYPCPDCITTMLPGITYTWPRTQGTGKVAWNPSWSWASGSGPPYPPDEYLECKRCKGTGLVPDRRQGVTERRADARERHEEAISALNMIRTQTMPVTPGSPRWDGNDSIIEDVHERALRALKRLRENTE